MLVLFLTYPDNKSWNIDPKQKYTFERLVENFINGMGILTGLYTFNVNK